MKIVSNYVSCEFDHIERSILVIASLRDTSAAARFLQTDVLVFEGTGQRLRALDASGANRTTTGDFGP